MEKSNFSFKTSFLYQKNAIYDENCWNKCMQLRLSCFSAEGKIQPWSKWAYTGEEIIAQ